MRVCFVGHIAARPDEGCRVVLSEIVRNLPDEIERISLDVSKPNGLGMARRFSPDIVHAVVGPASSMSLAAAKVWKRILKPKLLVVSAVQPTIECRAAICSLFKPDAILVQSEDSEFTYDSMGFKTFFVPNGVDTSRFVPVSNQQKSEIRKRIGFPSDKSVILHVGPAKMERNVHWLERLVRDDRKVIIVSRPSDPGDPELISHLRKNGVTVTCAFEPKIEQLYQASDGYAFPATDKRSCIETPLSILEACSCNLPVLTTPFGAIPRLLGGSDGVVFAENEKDFSSKGEYFETMTNSSMSRKATLDLDWKSICEKIVEIYRSLGRTRGATCQE